MATSASKIDAAAEKAYAEAAAKKVDTTTSDVSVAAIAKAVEAETAAPAKAAAPAKKVAAKKIAAKKPAAKKIVAKKKAAPKKAATAKKIAKKATAPKSKPAAKKTIPTIKTSISKDTIMTKAADYTAQVKDGLADLQARAKTVYGKGSEYAADMGEFTKGNVEAVVESGKILAAGLQDMGKVYVADAKGVVETVTADVKEVAAVRNPTDFVQLQGKIVSRNFDATVAAVSKSAEAWVKLTNEAFAPISNRMSLAMEKVRKAA
ncbi:MAG: phasin family protein [Pontixanthobacter sp.]